MNKIIGILLLLGLLILPASLLIGFSYTGSAHPIERMIIENDEFLKESANDVEILFFGYAGCATVCPVSLDKIAAVLESDPVENASRRVGGMFVEVKSLAEDDQPGELASKYSRTFSSRIQGYTPDLMTYQKLAHEFVVRLHESRNGDGRLSHTDHFFILTRSQDYWAVSRVLKNQIDVEQMTDIVVDTIKKSLDNVN